MSRSSPLRAVTAGTSLASLPRFEPRNAGAVMSRATRAGCRHSLLSCILGCFFFALLAVPSVAAAPARLKVVLNFQADGALGGFYQALDRGYYREAGLDVSFDFSTGSADAITRMASGNYDIGGGRIGTPGGVRPKKPAPTPP